MISVRMLSVRMDKWLWAARFFKTRGMAAHACELGRIQSNGQRAKASREVRAGDLLHVRNEGGDFEIKVLGVSQSRGPAAVAQAHYMETEESQQQRQKLAAERRQASQFDLPEGKPSKRNRREIDRLRGRS